MSIFKDGLKEYLKTNFLVDLPVVLLGSYVTYDLLIDFGVDTLPGLFGALIYFSASMVNSWQTYRIDRLSEKLKDLEKNGNSSK